MSLSLSVPHADKALIAAVSHRAQAYAATQGIAVDLLEVQRDFTACHANGNPLDLPRMMADEDRTLWHAASFLAWHMDPHTGQIVSNYRPSFIMQAAA